MLELVERVFVLGWEVREEDGLYQQIVMRFERRTKERIVPSRFR